MRDVSTHLSLNAVGRLFEENHPMMLFFAVSMLFLGISMVSINPFIGLCATFLVSVILGSTSLNVATLHPINYALLLALLGVLLRICLSRTRKRIIEPNAMRVLYILAIYAAITVGVYAMHGVSPNEYVRRIIKDGMRPALLVLIMLALIGNWKSIRVFVYIMLLGGALTAFVAVMQMLGIGFFWQLRENLGIIRTGIYAHTSIIGRSRPGGLADYFIPLGYQLCSLIPVIFGLIVVKVESFRVRVLLWIALVIHFLGLISSLDRAAVFGAVIGLLVVLLLSPLRRSRKLVLAMMIVGIVLSSILFLQPLKHRLTPGRREFKGLNRVYTAYVATKTIFDNPLGTAKLVEAYDEYHYDALMSSWGTYFTGVNSPHNQFLNTGVEFGFPALLMLILFYHRVFDTLISVRKRVLPDRFMYGLSIGLVGSFLSYILNSLFHNDGPLRGDFFNWFFVGLVVALEQVTSRSRYPLVASAGRE